MKIRYTIFIFVLVSASSVANAQIDRNILAGGRVIATGYEGVPQYLYEGDFDDTPFLTRNGEEQDPAYIGIVRNRQMTFERMLFVGGQVFPDGGWFDSESRPVEVQVLSELGAEWETVAEVSDYPSLNATDMGAAQAQVDAAFEVQFDPPVSGVGLRVIGKGASGDTPGQSFISMTEFRAFGELGGPANGFELPRLNGALAFGSTELTIPELQRGQGVADLLIDGIPETTVRAQEREDHDFRAFVGFFSANPLTLDSVSFVHGPLGEDGWFITDDGKPEVEIKTSRTGEWETAGTVENYPDISLSDFREDLPDGIETNPWTFEFSQPTEVFGVRIIGTPSFVFTDTPFVQIGEIMIDGEGDPEFRGFEGDGTNADGEPFTFNDDGIMFIEAEFGRVINEGFKIMSHGEATNGFVNLGTFGPSFNVFSDQGMEFEVEFPEDTTVFIFGQGVTQATWGDSLFVTLGDKPSFNADSLASGNLTWRPESVDQSQFTLERDWVTSDTLGQGGQEFFFVQAGPDLLEIRLREPRYLMDWLVVTTDEFLDIETFEPPESPPLTGIDDFSLF